SVLAIAPLIVAATQAAAAANASVDARIFEGKAAGEHASFLVVLREPADVSSATSIADRAERRRFVYENLRAHAEQTQAPLRRRLEAAGVRFRPHWLVDMLEVEGDAALANELAARADVSRIALNRPSRLARPEAMPPRAAPRDAGATAEPNIGKIGAPALWALGFTGQGIVLGLADTGFEWTHPAIVNRYRGAGGDHSYSWHDAVHDAAPGNRCGSDAPAPCDDEGHGTGTAGLAVGEGGIGAAPGATLIGCRNMDRGNGTPARYAECFEWLLAPTDSNGDNPRLDLGADVINNSWTCPPSEGCTDPEVLRGVVEAVRAAGVAVVFAAGNDGSMAAGGPQCFTVTQAPAIYAAALSVGATSIDDTLATFSSVGPVTADGSDRIKPDLTAPGVSLRTAAPGGAYDSAFSGTSGAAPQVSGSIALLWSAEPGLRGDVDRTEQQLELAAVPLRMTSFCGGYSGEDIPNPYFGWGRLDIATAYSSSPDRDGPVRLSVLPPTPRPLAPRP
ncbi:MAG: S8 family serine peptidase, partial [Syntrophomonadaceae bacterium]